MDECTFSINRIGYTINNYKRSEKINLGKIPEGMEIDSCSAFTLSSSSPVNTSGFVKEVNGDLIFCGNFRNVHMLTRVSVCVGFAPKK